MFSLLLIKFGNIHLDAINQDSAYNVDLKSMKTVKVMVEKLDDKFMSTNWLELNNKLNCTKTLNNELYDVQNECNISNQNIFVKRKHNSLDLNMSDILQKDFVKDQSSDKILMKNLRPRSISPEYFKLKRKQCLTSLNGYKSSNIIGRSINSIHKQFNYNSVSTKRTSDLVDKIKLTKSQSLSSLHCSAIKKLSRLKTSDLINSGKLKLHNSLTTKSTASSRKVNIKCRLEASNILSSLKSSNLKNPEELKFPIMNSKQIFNSKRKTHRLRSSSLSFTDLSKRSITPDLKVSGKLNNVVISESTQPKKTTFKQNIQPTSSKKKISEPDIHFRSFKSEIENSRIPSSSFKDLSTLCISITPDKRSNKDFTEISAKQIKSDFKKANKSSTSLLKQNIKKSSKISRKKYKIIDKHDAKLNGVNYEKSFIKTRSHDQS